LPLHAQRAFTARVAGPPPPGRASDFRRRRDDARALNLKNAEVERLAPLEAFRREFPDAVYGRHLSMTEEERILGLGPEGV
jgi:hypothetical protein